jgi:tetratricopeptide (TPR) repeat protein
MGAKADNSKPDRSRGPTRGRKWLFRLLAATVVPALLVGGLELALRLFGFGWPPGFFARNAAERTYTGSERFGWRFFPPSISRAPLMFSLPAAKRPGTYRVFVLGGSAAAGTPNHAYSFAQMLRAMLRGRFPEANFEVVNAAMTAVNSHVVRVIARDCAAHEPDLFIVYMGNNEVVGPYGPGTAFAGYSPSLATIRASIAVKGFRTGQLAGRIADALGGSAGPAAWGGLEMMAEHRVPADDPRLEGVYGHFEANLASIASAARDAGAEVIVCTVATNLRDCPPFASAHRAGLAEADRGRFEAFCEAAAASERAGGPEQARRDYARALEIDERFAELHYRLGRCLLQAGKPAEARPHFARARDLDALRFRADTRINEAIRRMAGEHAGRGVHLVDAEAVFAAHPRAVGHVPGEEAFHEHVHLTFEGNWRLAAAVFGKVCEVLPARVRGPQAGVPTPPDAARCAELLAYTDWDRYVDTRAIARMASLPPFPAQLDHARRAARRQQRLERLKVRLTPAAVREAIEAKRKALERYPGEPLLRGSLAQLYSDSGDLAAAEREYRTLLRQIPESSAAAANLGLVLLTRKRFAEAVGLFRRVLEVRPDQPQVLGALGVALYHAGRTEEAAETLARAVALDPNSASARTDLGSVRLRQGRPAEAAEQFRQALRLGGADRAARLGLAEALSRQGRHAEAAEQLRKLLEAGPDARVQYRLAVVLARAGRAAEAIVTAEAALLRAQAAGDARLAGMIERQLRAWRLGAPGP